MKFVFVILALAVLLSVSAPASAGELKHKETTDIHKLLDGIKARLLRERGDQEDKVTAANSALSAEKKNKADLLSKVSAVDKQIAAKNAVAQSQKSTLGVTSDRIDQELQLIERIRMMLDHLNGKNVGVLASHPAQSCAQLHAMGVRKDGLYYLQPKAWNLKSAVRFNCKFTKEGGYTLVWSNLFGSSESNKASSGLNWQQSLHSVSIIKGGVQSEALNGFTTYTGIARWEAVAPSGKLRYEWARSKSSAVAQQGTECDYKFEGSNWIRRLYNCKVVVGNTAWSYGHNNNRGFTASNADHDAWGGNCANNYKGPYWYGACWSGSIHGHKNHGAYYVGSGGSWEGNGWYWVR